MAPLKAMLYKAGIVHIEDITANAIHKRGNVSILHRVKIKSIGKAIAPALLRKDWRTH